MQTNVQGMKLHACTVGGCLQLESQDTKRHKRYFWRIGSKNRVTGVKAGNCACNLHSIPPKGWARHLNHLTSLTPEHISALTPHKEAAQYPLQGASHRFIIWFCSPLLWQGLQDLSEFLVWLLVNFNWLGKAKHLALYQYDLTRCLLHEEISWTFQAVKTNTLKFKKTEWTWGTPDIKKQLACLNQSSYEIGLLWINWYIEGQ